ncbi:hypothetical protein [Corallococcus sp. RDP092CA]|uniref:hypothetical protein n=1 Tax=Corallococcus sp. RDP092CA TaxID=3109369 RepID=UPI0035B2372B
MDASRLKSLMRQPLHVAALGLVRGESVTARANYVRLEVRDERGQLRFEHDTWREGGALMLQMRFAGEHLVTVFGDLFAHQVRVWDLGCPGAASRVDASWDDEGDVLLWADPASPRALVRQGQDVRMLDAASLALSRTTPLAVDADAVAYDATHHRLALGEWFDPAQLLLCDSEGQVLRTRSLGPCAVAELLFSGDGRFLAVNQLKRAVVVHDAETLEARWRSSSNRILAASPCGRWLALDGALVDLRSFEAVSLPPAQGALFDLRQGELLLADMERTWRVPLP